MNDKQIVDQNALESTTYVEKCDCLGECGYGPNVMRIIRSSSNDNNEDKTTLINQMRGPDNIYQALGIITPPLPSPSTTPEETTNESE